MAGPPIEIVAPTIVRMGFHGTLAGGRRWGTVVDVSLDEGPEERIEVIQDMVNNITGLYQDFVLDLSDQSVLFVGATWIDLNDLGGQSGTVGPRSGKPVAGQVSGLAHAPNVCILVHKHCVHNRRQRNGRMYIPGASTTAFGEDGTTGQTQADIYNTAMTQFRTGISSLSDVSGEPTMAWRVVHVLSHSGTPEPGWPNGRPTSWNSTDVDSTSVDLRAATQRNRLR